MMVDATMMAEAAACVVLGIAMGTAGANYPVTWSLAAWYIALGGGEWAWETWASRYSEEQQTAFAFDTLVLLMPGLVVGIYWVHGLALLLLELDWPGRLRFKIQPNKNVPMSKLPRVMGIVLASHIFIIWPACYLMFRTGRLEISHRFPSFAELLLNMAVFVVVDEAGFYYGHRAFHEFPGLYRYHKLHHEMTAPIGIAADFAHPLEQIFVNLLPNLVGPLLLRSHAVCLITWWVLTVIGTQCNHSGYRPPWLSDEERNPDLHDLHHRLFKYNYGSVGILDKLHGTFRDPLEDRDKAKAS